MSGKAVIKATQMFTTGGQASKVSVVKEIVIASVLGLAGGMVWQVSCFSMGIQLHSSNIIF